MKRLLVILGMMVLFLDYGIGVQKPHLTVKKMKDCTCSVLDKMDKTCRPGWVEVSGSCYFLLRTYLPWWVSRELCKDLDDRADLAQPTKIYPTLAYVMSMFPGFSTGDRLMYTSEYVWLGARRRGNGFKWVNGTTLPVDALHWVGSQQSGFYYDCIVFKSRDPESQKLDTHQCHLTTQGLCQYDMC
ncbi:unnamed protein product [Meganyctiphanes norvegica]|uniref:C-type lectin domain-containing protein n=1 Tax=Meganyctiphanes norvegica TaxID=48144 RepID=A0AAV2PTF2_MEGNR